MSSRTRASSPGGTLIQSGTFAARPAAGIADRYYWATDVQMMFRDTGVAWEIVSAGIQYAFYLMSEIAKTEINAGVTNEPAFSIWLQPIGVGFTCTVDAVVFAVGSPIAGNVRVGVYRDNGFTPAGGALLAESVSTALISTYRRQHVAIPATRLTPGLYWAALHGDSAQDYYTLDGLPANGSAPNLEQVVAHPGAYGPLPNPCLAVAPSNSLPLLSLRVASIP